MYKVDFGDLPPKNTRLHLRYCEPGRKLMIQVYINMNVTKKFKLNNLGVALVIGVLRHM